MADYTITLSMDPREALAGFRQMEQAAQATGQVIGQRLDQGVQRFSTTSLAGLQAELNRLQQRQLTVGVNTAAFDKLGQRINEIRGQIDAAQRQQLAIGVDDRSIVALQARLRDLQAQQVKVGVDTQQFDALGREIAQVQNQLSEVERKRILVSVDDRSLSGLQAKLQALQSQQVQVDVNSAEFVDLQREIAKTQAQIAEVEQNRVLVSVDANSITALNARLQGLQGELGRVAIGSQRFRELQAEIRSTEGEIRKAEQGSRSLGSALQAIQSIPFLAGFASLAGLGSLFKSAIDQAIQLETITRKLSNSLGAQGAAGALSFTKALANELGLSFNTLAGTFGSFTAAATSAGVPLQAQKDLFAAVSRSAQSLGLSNDELSGSLLALQQVASKGTVQMEELRGQLGERLPIAFAATARGLGVTQQELIKLVESGKLTADQFFPALTKGLNELSAGSGGATTAAQSFQKLDNAWKDLQTAFGQNLLPGVTKTVEELTKALEGLQAEELARDLQRAFSLPITDAAGLAGQLQNLQKEYGLTWQQAKNLLSVSIAQSGAGKNAFGQLVLGGNEYAQVQLRLIDLAQKFRNENPDLIAQKNAEAIAAAKVAEQSARALEIDRQRRVTADALAEIQGKAQVQGLGSQIVLGESLLSLFKAIGDVQQSRFNVTRSALEFELQQAEKRGASEVQIKAIKDQIAANDRQAFAARFQALQQEQQLQQAMLTISQEKATTEANLAVFEARVKLQEMEVQLSKAATDLERQKLQGAIEQQQVVIGMQQAKLGLLQQTQPIERASLTIQQEAARNGLQAEAAAKGYRIAIDGTLQPANALAALQGQITTLTTANATEQQRYTELARQSGIAIGTAKDGTVVLGRTQQEVNTAVEEMNKQLAAARTGFAETGNNAATTKGAVEGINTSLGNAQNPANALATAFATTGGRAPAIAQSSRDFAAYLSTASGFSGQIAGLNLDRRMGAVATETGRAATSARTFYDWLQKASDLPGSRWTGGPVEAGGEYRINELGQEAFLSAGRLSLIDAAPNSIWRAPSEGVVIPAGITARLQATGAVPVAAGSAPAGVAELAMEVGKLRQEVGNLARRDWSVRVTQRTGPTGSQVLRTLLS